MKAFEISKRIHAEQKQNNQKLKNLKEIKTWKKIKKKNNLKKKKLDLLNYFIKIV